MTTNDRFEDRLLTELRAVVAQRPAPAAAPAQAAPHRPPPRLVLGGLATVAAATVAAVVGLSVGGSSEPAYAVDRQSDGDVTVTINSLDDAAGLQRELRAAGVPAVVRYTPPGKMCRPPQDQAVPGPGAAARGKMTSRIFSEKGGPTTFTISRGSVGPGQTLFVSTNGGDGGPSSVGIAVVSDKDPTCELVDAPAAPPPGQGSGVNGPSFHTGP